VYLLDLADVAVLAVEARYNFLRALDISELLDAKARADHQRATGDLFATCAGTRQKGQVLCAPFYSRGTSSVSGFRLTPWTARSWRRLYHRCSTCVDVHML
jgi:hypothetical protein